MKVKSEREVAQLCPTLSEPMDCSLPGSSIHGSFQARVLESGAFAFSETNSNLLQKCDHFFLFYLLCVELGYLISLLFLEVGLYCYEPSP